MTQINKLFQILHDADNASRIALDSADRVNYPMLAVVSNNNDPDQKRRIKVHLPTCPGLESDWFYRLSIQPDLDGPVPKVGQSVVVFFLDGIETQGFYLSLQNATNPPKEKEDALQDHAEVTFGKRWLEVAKDYVLSVLNNLLVKVSRNISFDAGGTITFQNTAGASLILHQVGYTVFQDALGNKIVLGGQTYGLGYPSDIVCNLVSGDMNLNLNGNAIKFNNASSATLGGKEIATVGARDSRNDVLVDRGWN